MTGCNKSCSAVRDVYLEAACGTRPPMTEETRLHLNECPACHRWVSQLRRLDEGLGGLPVLEPASQRAPKASQAPKSRPTPAWVEPKAKRAGDDVFSFAGGFEPRRPRRSLQWAWVPAAGAAAVLAAVWTMVFVLKARHDSRYDARNETADRGAHVASAVQPAGHAVVASVSASAPGHVSGAIPVAYEAPPEVGFGPAYIVVDALPADMGHAEAAAAAAPAARAERRKQAPRDLTDRYPERYREIVRKYFEEVTVAADRPAADDMDSDEAMPESVVLPLFGAPAAPVDAGAFRR